MARLRLHAIDIIRRFPGIIWLLGIASFVNVGGLSLLWPVNAIYIHTVLHKPLTVAGLVLMVYSGAGFIGSFCGGWLYDRYGALRVLAGGLCIAGLFILIPVFTSGWWAYVAVMALFGIACAVPFPVLNALVGHAWPDGGRRGFNFIYVANNLGVAVGTALGGLLAEWSFHAVFVGIAVSYLVFFILLVTVFRSRFSQVRRASNAIAQPDGNLRGGGDLQAGGNLRGGGDLQADGNLRGDGDLQAVGNLRANASGSRQGLVTDLPVVPWVPILILFSGFVLVWAVYVQWQSTISVYMQALGYPLAWYSLLWTLNGLLIFGLQPLIAVVVRRFSSLSAQMCGGVVLFALAYLIVAIGHGYVTFVIGMVVMTLGELFAWPSVPAAIAQMAPEHRLGMLQGLVASMATLGRMIGPVIGGYLYDRVAANTLLWLFVLGTVVPFLCFLWFHRFYSRHEADRVGVGRGQEHVESAI
jgi:MFS family permease